MSVQITCIKIPVNVKKLPLYESAARTNVKYCHEFKQAFRKEVKWFYLLK